MQTNAAGQVVLKLKTPWRDGSTHLVMSPLEFMQEAVRLLTGGERIAAAAARSLGVVHLGKSDSGASRVC